MNTINNTVEKEMGISYNKEVILEALKKSNWMVIDNHVKGHEFKLAAIGSLYKFDTPFAVVEDVRYQSINEVYYSYSDERVHLSCLSCGAVLYGTDYERYNQNQQSGIFYKPITDIYTAAGEHLQFAYDPDKLKEYDEEDL